MTNSLANDSEILLLNLASIQNLSEKVKETCKKKNEDPEEFSDENITLRFRGNIVVEACEPFEEEKWDGFSTESVMFSVVGPCKRCQMVTVEQTSGQITKEPLRSLSLIKNRHFNFGVHTSITTCSDAAQLSINDVISVMSVNE